MGKCTTHLIPENIMPRGAKGVGVYNDKNVKVGYVPFGRTVRPTDTPDYTFMALSDIHLTYDTANADFERALEYAENNCDFTCICGDLTSSGTEDEMSKYAEIVLKCAVNKHVHAISGNHENYSTRSAEYFETKTGNPLYYSFTRGDDVFVMLGHYGGYHDGNGGWRSYEFISMDELQWLYETLEENRNKRCFVFNHTLPYAHGVGNPNNLYYGQNPSAARIWTVTDGGIGQALIDLLCHYRNSILFTGHSHTRFSLQTLDPKANYGEVRLADGRTYKSIHIPSLAVPRDIAPAGSDKPLTEVYAESEGYIVEVYPDYIVLNGRDFVDNESDGHWLPIATYRIDTPLHTVEAGTFVDSTGLINTN